MLYSVNVVLGVNSSSWHGETESDDFTSCYWMMVELRIRNREMGGYGGNHHEILGLERISYLTQFTIPDTAGITPDTRSSQFNLASRTPGFSYRLVSSTSFSSTFPISPFLVPQLYRHRRPQSSVIPFYPSMLWLWVDTEYSIHQVQRTPSTAYTEYSIYRVQHTQSTASIGDWFSSLHSHDYELTHECSFSIRCSTLYNRPPSASSPTQLKVNSHCHIPMVAS